MAVDPGCAAARERLETLVDGDLPDEQAGALRAHLAGCRGCRAHHDEAASLPVRLAALRSPDPAPALLSGVMSRIRGDAVGPVRFWSLPAAEAALFLVALWYLSGLQGLAGLVQATSSDVAALAGWGAGASAPPAPQVDLFLLLVSGLLVAVTLYHLTLLSRQGPRLS